MKAVLGYLLIGAALLIIIFTFLPVFKEEINYQKNSYKYTDQNREISPIDNIFGIVIPKLNINAKVIKDVDPFDQKSYQLALTKGIAHAKGTKYPGESGNTFIFSHSSENFFEATRYNSVFYLLQKLDLGDKIIAYYNNNKFEYKITEKKIIDAGEVDYLKNKSTEPTLTLMTCWPPGTDLKRLIVRANISK